jgi:hypothetical protein
LLAEANDTSTSLVSEQKQQRSDPHQPVPARAAVGPNDTSEDWLIHVCSLQST